MEKRTILAFVLSFVVLVGWSMVFGPSRQAEHKSSPPGRQAAAPASAEKTTAGAAATSPPAVPAAVPGRTSTAVPPAPRETKIRVDTPLYSAVFTNRGPGIRSFRLKKYHRELSPQSPLVDLVAGDGNPGNFLLTRFESSASPETEDPVYRADRESVRLGPGSGPKDLVFETTRPDGLTIRQSFRFYPDRYQIDHTVTVINRSAAPVTGVFQARLNAMPKNGRKQYYSFTGLALLLNGKLKEVKLKKAGEEKQLTGRIDWMAYETGFFISAVIPKSTVKATFNGHRTPSGLLQGTCLLPQVSLRPSGRASASYLLYLGPREIATLKQVGRNLDRAVDFGWFDIIARPLLFTLRFFNRYIHNYGVSIILLTILIKILFWPLTHKSYKSMKEMQKIQPRMAKIREKYKNDKQKLNQEMMALYKTYKVNPMGGCLPMVIQIPVFFALYRLLGSAIELRHAPFMLWINDLSAPDRLFRFPFSIPFMAPPYGIPVLTLLMGVSMFFQQKMTPAPGDPTQAKIMMFLPVVFTFMFINFPSGLVLYWFVNNILSIGQQYRIYKSRA